MVCNRYHPKLSALFEGESWIPESIVLIYRWVKFTPLLKKMEYLPSFQYFRSQNPLWRSSAGVRW